MDNSPTSEQSKVIRLVNFLSRIASLRTNTVRDVKDYQKILWISDIPRQKECFAQAWAHDEEVDSDVWVSVQKRAEPKLPRIPAICDEWIDKSSLEDKTDLPTLFGEITTQVKNPDWKEDSDEPEFIACILHIVDFPDVQGAWNQFVEERWLPWVDSHNEWKKVDDVYTTLHTIHQEQRRLGEEYEFVLGLGLLTWQTPNQQRVNRHLIVANALLEFEARLAKFTIRAMPDGANVRPELDMLDIEDQPAHAEELAKSSLTITADDPWDKSCVEGVLRAIVNSIKSSGEYDESLEGKGAQASSKPVVKYAPALILRERSTRGLTRVLERIKERIEQGEPIPSEFRNLAEVKADRSTSKEQTPDEPTRRKSKPVFDGEIYFPKPANEDQRRIVEKLRGSRSVLVQGPPGTGKSHTIANLICHLLATGRRILVTAKTPRALQVLQGLLPEEIRPLAISQLGDGLAEKKSLETSVDGILRKNDEWNQDRAVSEIEELEQQLCSLREEQAKTNRRILAIRESEKHTQSIANGTYQGTAARIAEAVERDRDKYGWFTDKVPLDQPCRIKENALPVFLAELRRLTPDRRREMNLVWPTPSVSSEQFAKLVGNERRSADEELRSSHNANAQMAASLSTVDMAIVRSIHESVLEFESERKRLSCLRYGWLCNALHDILNGNPFTWRELYRLTRDTITSIEPIVYVADETTVDVPDHPYNVGALLDDVCELIRHLESGGQLGWGPFRSRQVKERKYVFKTVRVNGHLCTDHDRLTVLSKALKVRHDFEKLSHVWASHSESTVGPYALRLHEFTARCQALNDALALQERLAKCQAAIRQCPFVPEPIWADQSQAEQLIASCRLAMATYEKRHASNEIEGIESPLRDAAEKANAHPITQELISAISNRDVDGFGLLLDRIKVLNGERDRTRRLDEGMAKLRQIVPKLARELELTSCDNCWDERVRHMHRAWNWAQAQNWINDYIRKEDLPSLVLRSRQIEDEINSTITKLAAIKAWSFCCSRLKKTEGFIGHMRAWSNHINSLTKTGKGIRDFRNRQAAQRHLTECKDAVPAWVMPLHRVWDTVDPKPGMFDVVIVDEASQCGLEALPLTYLAKKILIVGDDKQISPEGQFQDATSINKLIDEFLSDFEYKEYFDVNKSLFDHVNLRCGEHRITLREHFRCMPEIIRFSNDLCYSQTPLIPLRQYGSDRLPPLERVFVSGGHRQGSKGRVINRPEADAIVNKIVELCADQRYSGKSMGVVVLQGDAQAGLIEEQLLKRLGAEVMEQRRLVCGKPYDFQGDERDIMFLSMVAAPNEQIGPKTKPADERQFNVAASRAKDQMFLFHSVSVNNLSANCLRRRLLEFFENTNPQEIAGIERNELERRAMQDDRSIVKPPAPFDSWFEVDVALEIARRGFNVCPQHEVASKKIDLVVFQGSGKLAVECDGDKWHSADRYEADMQRQRQLERCGWEFFRVRESAFYANKESALNRLWQMLEERQMLPFSSRDKQLAEPTAEIASIDAPGEDVLKHDRPKPVDDSQDERPEPIVNKTRQLCIFPSQDDAQEGKVDVSRRQVADVTDSEIRDAIIAIRADSPNISTESDAITKLVLRHLGVSTRGNPRKKFGERVTQVFYSLARQNQVDEYEANNFRVHLAQRAA